MMISENIKQFIESHIEDIEANDWDQLYKDILLIIHRGDEVCEFTQAMLSCDINPLLYMKQVPQYYLCGNKDIKEFIIPNNIEIINRYAFIGSQIEKIHIPPSITNIYERAFSGCKELNHIYIDDLVQFSKINFETGGNPFFCNMPIFTPHGYLNNISFEQLGITYSIYCDNWGSISSALGYRDERITFECSPPNFTSVCDNIPEAYFDPNELIIKSSRW